MHINKHLLRNAPLVEVEPRVFDIPNYTKAMMWLNKYANTEHYTKLKGAFDMCYFDRVFIKKTK